MHFLSPWWWLLFLPLAGGIVILYLLKLRRRDQVVSSVFLWEQALQDLQANAPLQKLKKNLLLLVQLLVLLLVVAALTRPSLMWRGQGGRDLVLVIDASASMQSTDVFPTRFAAAKSTANKAVEAMGAHDRMMIIAVGGATRTLTSFTSDTRALHSAIDKLQVTDCPADLQGAIELVAGLLRGSKRAEKPVVQIISDGALPAAALPAGMDAPIHYQQIGKRGENAAIVMMDVRRYINRDTFEGVVVLGNYSGQEARGTLEISLNGSLLDARDIAIAKGGARTEVVGDLPAGGGVLKAKFDCKDDLPSDNEAQLILPKVEPLDVVLLTKGNVFLETALALDKSLRVTKRDSLPSPFPAGAVLIADNVSVTGLPERVGALLIGEAAATGASSANPVVVDWDRRHPALRNVDLAGVNIGGARKLALEGGARTLIDSDGGAIATADDSRAGRRVSLGWVLQDSDFPLNAGFPIFLGNVVEWISDARSFQPNYRTGLAASIPVPPGVKEVTLRAPDGSRRKMPVSSGRVMIDGLPRAGVYELSAPNFSLQLTANLASAAESDLTPRKQLALQGRTGAATASNRPISTDREYWRILAIAGLLLLCAEWWIFHRRIG